MRSGSRFSLTVVALILLVTGLWVWSVIDEVSFARERIGVFVEETEDGVLVPGVSPGMPAERAGAQAGDIVRSLEGEPIADLESLNAAFERHFEPGKLLTVTVERDGEMVMLSLVPGVAPPINQMLAQLVLVVAYLGLGLLAARYRKRDRRAALLAIFSSIVAIELALPTGLMLDSAARMAILLAWLMMTGIQMALELHLISLVPRPLRWLQDRPRRVAWFYVLGAASAIVLVSLTVWEWRTNAPLALTLSIGAQTVVLAMWALLSVGLLLWQIYRNRDRRQRQQAILVLCGVLPWSLYILITSLAPEWQFGSESTNQLVESLILLIFPAAVFVAIFRYGLFAPDRLIQRTLVYGLIAGLIIILLYALLTTALPWIDRHVEETVGLWLVAAVAMLIGMLFRPLRRLVERLVERGLTSSHHRLRQKLITIAAQLAQHQNLETLAARLSDDAQQALDVRWTAVLVRAPDSDEARAIFSAGVERDKRGQLQSLLEPANQLFEAVDQAGETLAIPRLERSQPETGRRLRQAGAELLVPLYVQERLVGALCLGSRRDGVLFNREEMDLIDLFSHQIAISLENVRLSHDATFEELTGLLRREAALRQFQELLGQARNNRSPVAALMLDLDYFKQVNDAHGHLFGDEVLKQIARVMSKQVRTVDIFGRYGGEEFLLVLPDTEINGARIVADKLRTAVGNLRMATPDGGQLSVTLSIGIACWRPGQPEPDDLVNQMLRTADQAVYEAKHGGRNRIVAAPGLVAGPTPPEGA